MAARVVREYIIASWSLPAIDSSLISMQAVRSLKNSLGNTRPSSSAFCASFVISPNVHLNVGSTVLSVIPPGTGVISIVLSFFVSSAYTPAASTVFSAAFSSIAPVSALPAGAGSSFAEQPLAIIVMHISTAAIPARLILFDIPIIFSSFSAIINPV